MKCFMKNIALVMALMVFSFAMVAQYKPDDANYKLADTSIKAVKTVYNNNYFMDLFKYSSITTIADTTYALNDSVIVRKIYYRAKPKYSK